MARSHPLTAKLILLIGFIALLRLLLLPGAPASTPYASALDKPAPSLEAGGCPNKACDHGLECFAATGYKCIRFNGKGCSATAC
jgi:hypothetical protein